MKQAEDNKTLELALPKRRGRPPIANPMSAAERQARHRLKKELRNENAAFFSLQVLLEYDRLNDLYRSALPPRLRKAIEDLRRIGISAGGIG